MTKQALEPTAIYWNLLTSLVVPRGQEGQFYGTREGKVIQVVQPGCIEFQHFSGPAFFEFEPGDVIVRVNQPADEVERKWALALTGREITHVAVAERFSDAYALDTALRQSTRQIPKSLLGRRERIDHHFYRIPGGIDKVFEEAESQKIIGQYGGVIARARALRRIQFKIEGGFRTAYHGLMVAYQELYSDQITTKEADEKTLRTWIYLVRVASFNPYYTIVHSTPEVQRLKSAEPGGAYDKVALLRLIKAAIPPLEKGWRGFRVQPQEIRAAWRRLP